MKKFHFIKQKNRSNKMKALNILDYHVELNEGIRFKKLIFYYFSEVGIKKESKIL